MRNIKSYYQYINEGSQELSGIDLQSEFDYLNDLIWNGDVRKTKVEWADLKLVGARTLVQDDEPKRVVGIEVSSFYDVPEPDLRNQLAHEMLHAYMVQKCIEDDGFHGTEFKRLAREINNRNLGIEIDVTDDVSCVHPVDMTPLEEPLGVVLYRDGSDGWGMLVMSPAEAGTYDSHGKVEHRLLSRDPDLRKYTMSSRPYTISDAKAMELIDGAEQIPSARV